MAVLITCALSAGAHQLKNRLKDSSMLLGDFAGVPEFMIKTGQLIQLPNPGSITYQHEMLALCLDNGIETVYSLSEQEFIALKESELLFSEYGITILQNN